MAGISNDATERAGVAHAEVCPRQRRSSLALTTMLHESMRSLYFSIQSA